MGLALALSLLLNVACLAIATRLIRKRGGLAYLRSWLVARGVWQDEAKTRFEHAYRDTKIGLFEGLPASPTDVLFVGDSLTEGGPWHELFQDARCKNRGIAGDTSAGLLDRLEPLLASGPAQVFLLIGANDLLQQVPVEAVLTNVRRVVELVAARSPNTRLILQGLTPLDPGMLGEGSNATIQALNTKLQALATEAGLTFLGLYPLFEQDGKLSSAYTHDGLHLNARGYMVWRDALQPHLEALP